jgi:hypothetical protein
LVLDVFSFAVDKIWSFSKIAPMKKVYKWGENGFFRKPYISAQRSNLGIRIATGNMMQRRITLNYYNYDIILHELRRKNTYSIN